MKEFIMTMVSNKSIGEGALKNKRKTIFEQFKIIEKWISDTSTKLKCDEIEAKELGRSNISQKLFQFENTRSKRLNTQQRGRVMSPFTMRDASEIKRPLHSTLMQEDISYSNFPNKIYRDETLSFTIDALDSNNAKERIKSRNESRIKRLLSPKQRTIIESMKSSAKNEEESK